MNNVRQLFLKAIEQPEHKRDAWLKEQCGDDKNLLAEVRSLIEHHNLSDDPLEKRLDEALAETPTNLGNDEPVITPMNDDVQFDSNQFLSRLLEVGVMSKSEVKGLSEAIAAGRNSSSPDDLANSLVKDGRLTQFQAKALLKGQPELLIDKYLILDIIDSGGMGIVFKALHRPMNRVVAIKMLPQNLVNSEEKINRFRREVRVAATLSHPNIVTAFDADESRGIHFLVMEYVSGQDLRKYVQQKGPFSVQHAVAIIRRAADALKYAHRKNIIHRDIKPQNIMLTKSGKVKVLDMGLARFDETGLVDDLSMESESGLATDPTTEHSSLTQAGAVMGTAAFMAPEQAIDAKSVDARTDIYSLGCTLHFLLAGNAPYEGDSAIGTLMLHREADIPSLIALRSDVPKELDAIVQQMLAKQPEDRFQTMQEVLDALEDCPMPTEKQARKPSKNNESTSTRSSVVDSTIIQPPTTSNIASTVLVTLIGLFLFVGLIASGYYLSSFVSKPAHEERRKTELANTTEPIPTINTKPSYALQFDGEDDYVAIPTLRTRGDEPQTIELTVRLPQRASDNIESGTLIETGSCWIDIASSHGAQMLRGSIVVPSQGYVRHVQKIDFMQAKLAFVYDTNSVSLFVNGVLSRLSRTKHATRPTSTIDEMERFHPIKDGDFATIGSPNWRGRFFKGQIDEVRISNVARYTDNYAPPDRLTSDNDTLALYHFDEGKGDVLVDSSGNEHHGTIHGATWVRNEEILPKADQNHVMSFDGIDDYVHIPNLKLTSDTSYTIECRLTPSNQDPFGSAWVATGEQYLALDVGKDNQWAPYYLRDDTRTIHQTGTVEPNRTYNVAVIIDRGHLSFFVDGKKLDAPPTSTQSRDPIPESHHQGFYIGSGMKDWSNPTEPHRPFRGTIDELRISKTIRYTEDYTPVDRFKSDEHTLALYHFDEAEKYQLIDASGNGHHGRIQLATWASSNSTLSQSNPTKSIQTNESPPPKNTDSSNDAIRNIAEQIIQLGGFVSFVNRNQKNAYRIAQIPTDDFTLNYVGYSGVDFLVDAKHLALLRDLPDLTTLYFGKAILTDAAVTELATLQRLEEIHFRKSDLTNEDLARLTVLKNVEMIEIEHTELTNDGLKLLADFPSLRRLTLENADKAKFGPPKISDEGLVHLAKIPNLERLWLMGPNFTDAGIEHLIAIKSLVHLNIGAGEMTADGIEQLKQRLPQNCRFTLASRLTNPSNRAYLEMKQDETSTAHESEN